MTNSNLLEKYIRESGIKRCVIAEKCGVTAHTLRNKIRNESEFTASEIVALAKILALTNKTRDEIFLA